MAFVNNRWVLAGITSIGPGCARRGFLGIYTRVASFVPFITATVKSASVTAINLGNTVPSQSVSVSLDKFVYILACLFLCIANL